MRVLRWLPPGLIAVFLAVQETACRWPFAETGC